MSRGLPTTLWGPSRGTKPAKINCGDHGWLTVREISVRTGLSKGGVFSRLRKVKRREATIEDLLQPVRGRTTSVRESSEKKQVLPVETTDPYWEGVAAYPETECPYQPISLPQSHLDRSHSPMTCYAAWWAGWHDTDRGLT